MHSYWYYIFKGLTRPNFALAYLFGRSRLSHIVPDKYHVRIMYFLYTGRLLSFRREKLKTFNDKLQWLRIYYYRDAARWSPMADKYAVRDYIKKKLGKEYLIPLLAVYDSPDQIDIRALPERFVLKCNHDSGSVIVCKDKRNFDLNAAKKHFAQKLGVDYFWPFRDYCYKHIRPIVLAEQYMENEDGSDIRDYKVHCFDGVPTYVGLDVDRFNGKHFRNFYDTDWNLQPWTLGAQNHPEYITKKPELLGQMLEIAGRLSTGTPYLRVDFYIICNRLYFGEITFLHGGGVEAFGPREIDVLWGSLLNLPE